MIAEFHLQATASEMSVRALLVELRARLCAAGMSQAACGTVEIVIAEALNNIVEHAYHGADTGEIGLHAWLGQAGLVCTLSDRGSALPALHLPEGRPPDIGTQRDALPEGGFGWFLIQSLARNVHYMREDGGNRLTLRFALPNPDEAGN